MEPKPSIPLCQTEKSSTVIENKTILNDFPKVGVRIHIFTLKN
jgi:hypothetical protein